MISPFWSRISGCVVSKPVRSWRFDIEWNPFDLKRRVIIRNAWTSRKTNAAVKTIGKRKVNIKSTFSLCHRNVGWLSQNVDHTGCQNRSHSNQSEDGRGVVAHNKLHVWRNVTRSHEHPWMVEAQPAKTWGQWQEWLQMRRAESRSITQPWECHGWLSTSTGSSIAMGALQPEEGLWTRHGKS